MNNKPLEINLLKYYFKKYIERIFNDTRNIISPKRQALYCSFMYTANSLFQKQLFSTNKFKVDCIKTIYGSFYIRRNTLDIICCLPSYESEDIIELSHLINTDNSSRTLFVDVGADLGTYCISIMKSNPKVDTIAFEPNPKSRRLLIKNIKLNKLEKKIKVFPYAVSNMSGKKIAFESNIDLPGSSTVNTPLKNHKHNKIQVETIKLDSILLNIASKYDNIYIKMDIERNEKNAIIGSQKFLQKYGYKTTLLIEDFLDSSFEKELDNCNFFSVNKLTPYNRWYKQRSLSISGTIKQ